MVVTFDESDFENGYDPAKAYKYTYDGPNMIYTVLLGDCVHPGVQTEGYNHYSLLHTVEKNFELGSLGKNDEDCSWFRFLWGEQFRWGTPSESALEVHGAFDVVEFRGALYLVYTDKVGDLWLRVALGDGWSDPRPVGAKCHGSLRLAASGDRLILVSHDEGHRLRFLAYTLDKGWSAEGAVVEQPTRAFALASYGVEGELMLVWRGEDDYLMRLAHLLNALALATRRVMCQVRERGVQAFLRWVRESCAHRSCARRGWRSCDNGHRNCASNSRPSQLSRAVTNPSPATARRGGVSLCTGPRGDKISHFQPPMKRGWSGYQRSKRQPRWVAGRWPSQKSPSGPFMRQSWVTWAALCVILMACIRNVSIAWSKLTGRCSEGAIKRSSSMPIGTSWRLAATFISTL